MAFEALMLRRRAVASVGVLLALMLEVPVFAQEVGSNETATEPEPNSTAPVAEEAPVEELPEEPPRIEFTGKAPKLKIFPSSDPNSSWVMLEFGSVQELDAGGKKVGEHSIASLASRKDILWEQDIATVGGAEATVTTMTLPLRYGQGFSECKGARRLKGPKGPKAGGEGGAPAQAELGNVTIKTFVFNSDAVIAYGDETIDVYRGQMKFNIEGSSWPFCRASNSLSFRMNIKMKGDGGAKAFGKRKEHTELEEEEQEAEAEEPSMEQSASSEDSSGEQDAAPPSPPTDAATSAPAGRRLKPEGKKQRRKPKGKAFVGDAGDKDVVLDLPTSVLLDGGVENCSVDLEAKGDKIEIVFTMPYFSDNFVYDPVTSFEETASESELSSIVEENEAPAESRNEAMNAADAASIDASSKIAPGLGALSSSALCLAAAAAALAFPH